jgi:hypothetical protein
MNLSLPLTLPDYVREGNHDRQRRSWANRAQLSREQLRCARGYYRVDSSVLYFVNSELMCC